MARHLAPTSATDILGASGRPVVCPSACAPSAQPVRGHVCPSLLDPGRCGGLVTIAEVIAAAEVGPGWDAVAAARLTGSVCEGLALARLVAGLRARGLYSCAADVA